MKIFYSYIPLKQNIEDMTFDAICIKLSSTILKKMGYAVGIYSNKTFIDFLKTNSIDLDFYENIEKEVSPFVSKNLFAVSKLYANSIQTEPFIQIDYDTFFFDDFQFDKFDSKFLFGFRETVSGWTNSENVLNWKNVYLDFYVHLYQNFNLPFIEKCQPLLAFNCNVVGGTEYKVLADSYNELFEFTKKHIKLADSFYGNPMAVLEQLLIIGQLAHRGFDTNEDVTMCSSKNMVDFIDIGNNTTKLIIRDNEYLLKTDKIHTDCPKSMMTMLDYNFAGYLHLLGARNLITIRHMLYSKLKAIDLHFVKRFELNFGKKYKWQTDIYKSLL
jgi:hypothetical protein